jgi:hypothetical protein
VNARQAEEYITQKVYYHILSVTIPNLYYKVSARVFHDVNELSKSVGVSHIKDKIRKSIK